jgi:hypothetical protein
MGIERSGRKPKRRRTTAQRMKGRREVAFVLPDGPAPAPTAKKAAKPKADKKSVSTSETKSPAKKSVAAKKPAAKKSTEQKSES